MQQKEWKRGEPRSPIRLPMLVLWITVALLAGPHMASAWSPGDRIGLWADIGNDSGEGDDALNHIDEAADAGALVCTPSIQEGGGGEDVDGICVPGPEGTDKMTVGTEHDGDFKCGSRYWYAWEVDGSVVEGDVKEAYPYISCAGTRMADCKLNVGNPVEVACKDDGPSKKGPGICDVRWEIVTPPAKVHVKCTDPLHPYVNIEKRVSILQDGSIVEEILALVAPNEE